MNGICTREWDPATDPRLPLPARYSAATALRGKARAKALLQERLGLRLDPSAPLVGFVGRLTEQKGVDVLLGAAPALLTAPPAPGPLRAPLPFPPPPSPSASGTSGSGGGTGSPGSGGSGGGSPKNGRTAAVVRQQELLGDSIAGAGPDAGSRPSQPKTGRAASSGSSGRPRRQRLESVSSTAAREGAGRLAAPAALGNVLQPAVLAVPPAPGGWEAFELGPAAPCLDEVAEMLGAAGADYSAAFSAHVQQWAGEQPGGSGGSGCPGPLQLVVLGTGEVGLA